MKFSSTVTVFTKAESRTEAVDDSESLFAFLKKAEAVDNAGVVRLKDDVTFFEVQSAFQESMQKAGNASHLAGGSIPFWGIAGNFADGDGWRMMIVAMRAQPQMTPSRLAAPNGR